MKETQSKKAFVKPLICGVVAFVLCIAGFAGFNVYSDWRAKQDAMLAAQAIAEEEAQQKGSDVAEKVVENPIDFASLQAQNSDIYAWITIPGTNVDYPILQSNVDDNYYLRRDENRNAAEFGALFTQSCNAKDFSDPVTVVYGHYATNDAYFATLHYFENADFFNTHQTIYVYTPTHLYTYQVIAAYQYDDRHIMNSYNFSRESERLRYFESILQPSSMLSNVREGAQLSADSKILQLSTCMSSYIVSNTRYIVTGVLTNEQVTY